MLKLDLVVIGAGGLASEVVDAYLLMNPAGRLGVWSTPRPKEFNYLFHSWRGEVREINESIAGSNFVVAIGDPSTRKNIFDHIEKLGGIPFTVIHPQAVCGSDSSVGSGSILLAGATVTVNAKVGKGCLLNPGTRISHDSAIGEFITFGPNSVVAGKASVGNCSLIGAGAVINPGVQVAAWTVLGSGSVVTHDLDESGTWIGVPARRINN